MGQPLPVEGNYKTTVYSVETGASSDDIVITMATNSSESPAFLAEQLIPPLERTTKEVSDINEQISFTVQTTERLGTYIYVSIYV